MKVNERRGRCFAESRGEMVGAWRGLTTPVFMAVQSVQSREFNKERRSIMKLDYTYGHISHQHIGLNARP